MKEGFEERFQEYLGCEEFEVKMEEFMSQYALYVVRDSDIGESKGHEGEFEGGEFSHDVYRCVTVHVCDRCL